MSVGMSAVAVRKLGRLHEELRTPVSPVLCAAARRSRILARLSVLVALCRNNNTPLSNWLWARESALRGSSQCGVHYVSYSPLNAFSVSHTQQPGYADVLGVWVRRGHGRRSARRIMRLPLTPRTELAGIAYLRRLNDMFRSACHMVRTYEIDELPGKERFEAERACRAVEIGKVVRTADASWARLVLIMVGTDYKQYDNSEKAREGTAG